MKKYFNENPSTVLLAIYVLACLFVLGLAFGSWLGARENAKPRTDMPMMIFGEPSEAKLAPLVRLHDSKTHEFFCSGTVISDNYVVTAGHCLEGRSKRKPSIEIVTDDGVKTSVKGIAAFYEDRSDTGLVLGDFSGFNSLTATADPTYIIPTMLTPYISVIACGFPYGGEVLCVAVRDRRQYSFGFAGSGLLYPGMSGGPVIDAATGVLIGVNTGVFADGIYISPLVELLVHAKVKVTP